MRKIVFAILVMVVSISAAMGQFRLDLGLGLNLPHGELNETFNPGFSVFLEPKFELDENLGLGLFIGRSGFKGETSFEDDALVPLLFTGTYRFSGNKHIPYLGLGGGLYFDRVLKVEVDAATGTTFNREKYESKLGLAPRVGIYLGRLNFGGVYNIVNDASFIQFSIAIEVLKRN